jgi:Fe-S-cluster-containing dehydrogenase component
MSGGTRQPGSDRGKDAGEIPPGEEPRSRTGRSVRRRVVVNADLCTGCRLCELACADVHEGLSGPDLSRIRVEAWPEVNAWFPLLCVHCTRPPCVDACPTTARSKEKAMGRVLVRAELCTGCGECTLACPHDAPRMHPQEGVSLGCNLCDGAPACVEVCTSEALVFAHPSEGVRRRQRAWAERH